MSHYTNFTYVIQYEPNLKQKVDVNILFRIWTQHQLRSFTDALEKNVISYQMKLNKSIRHALILNVPFININEKNINKINATNIKNKQLFVYGLCFVPGICKQSGRIKSKDYNGYLKWIITILYGITIGIHGRCIYNWESLYKHVIYACIALSTIQMYHIYNLKMEAILTPKSIYLFVNAILKCVGAQMECYSFLNESKCAQTNFFTDPRICMDICKFTLINKHECVQVCFVFFFFIFFI